jgi:DNA-binding NarL/FixJ family response regulator
MTIRVLIVDDHAIVRQGLKMFLATDDAIEVVGEAPDGLRAIDMARALQPDVVLMDLLMPAMDGITATAELRRHLPQCEVIALTSVLEDRSVIGAVKAGAIGYLLKDTDADSLCQAIRAAAEGKVQLAPEAAARLVREVSTPDVVVPLTERENEVLKLLATGLTNKEIAFGLHIGESTVKTHVGNILVKLDVQSRTQAALYAAKVGLVDVAGSPAAH